jgi:hypothetical protein
LGTVTADFFKEEYLFLFWNSKFTIKTESSCKSFIIIKRKLIPTVKLILCNVTMLKYTTYYLYLNWINSMRPILKRMENRNALWHKLFIRTSFLKVRWGNFGLMKHLTLDILLHKLCLRNRREGLWESLFFGSFEIWTRGILLPGKALY